MCSWAVNNTVDVAVAMWMEITFRDIGEHHLLHTEDFVILKCLHLLGGHIRLVFDPHLPTVHEVTLDNVLELHSCPHKEEANERQERNA
jgi:hypothetical protein